MFSSSGFEQESCPCAPSAYASTFCQHETTKQYPRAYQSREKSTHDKSISYFIRVSSPKPRWMPQRSFSPDAVLGVCLALLHLHKWRWRWNFDWTVMTGRSLTICICNSAFTDFGNMPRWHGTSKKSNPRNTTVSGVDCANNSFKVQQITEQFFVLIKTLGIWSLLSQYQARHELYREQYQP